MSSPGGAATQVYSPQFDQRFFKLPAGTQSQIQRKIDELGRDLNGFSHYRMQGVDAFRVRAGDFRIIYQFNLKQNELFLLAIGHRRDIYKKLLN